MLSYPENDLGNSLSEVRGIGPWSRENKSLFSDSIDYRNTVFQCTSSVQRLDQYNYTIKSSFVLTS